MTKIIRDVECGYEAEPLREPFGFKGRSLTELWQVCVRLKTDDGDEGVGIGVQSVLWSDPVAFADLGEIIANQKMYLLTKRALTMLKDESFTSPPKLIQDLLPELVTYAQQIFERDDIPLTLVLNALVPVDFALWGLWQKIHEVKEKPFTHLVQQFAELTPQQSQLGLVPLVSYNVSRDEIHQLLQDGAFFLKIKIGAKGDAADQPQAMVQEDLRRIQEIHHIACRYETPYTQTGQPAYYLDANGRYPSPELLDRLISGLDELGIVDKILILEEPYANALAMPPVSNFPLPMAADESAHSPEDVSILTTDLGYKAVACKPIAKTLSLTLQMIRVARDNGAACFCADLTVPPVMLDWNMALASCLEPIAGLKIGIIESNGAQNYQNWNALDERCPTPRAPWRMAQDGIVTRKPRERWEADLFKPLLAYPSQGL